MRLIGSVALHRDLAITHPEASVGDSVGKWQEHERRRPFRKFTRDWAYRHPTPPDFFRAMDNTQDDRCYARQHAAGHGRHR